MEPPAAAATVFRGSGRLADMEAQVIRGVLETNGIEAVITDSDVLPDLYHNPGKEVFVLVPGADREEAERLIREALEAGPAAAVEGEAATEGHV